MKHFFNYINCFYGSDPGWNFPIPTMNAVGFQYLAQKLGGSESIEFLGITNEMDENIANYKISSADGRVIKMRMFYKKNSNGKKVSYAFFGLN